MSFLSSLFQTKKVVVVEEVAPPPIEYCPACKEVLVKVHQEDGVYCQECAELLSFYVADMYPCDRPHWRSPLLPNIYGIECPRCHHDGMGIPDIEDFDKKSREAENLKECGHCSALLHAPAGFCVICWNKLANNGRCINHECPRYHKPEKARFIPIYEVRAPSPHCGSCGQPYIVLNKEVGNEKIAQVTLGQGGYEWISEKTGCNKCGAAFEKPKK